MSFKLPPFSTRIRWLLLLILIAFAAFQKGNIQAFLVDFENAPASIFAGIWEVDEETKLEASNSTVGFLDEGVYGVRGQVCITNIGNYPTSNLEVSTTVQARIGDAEFVDYVSAPLALNENPEISPSESHCYPYEVTFAPPPNEDVTYRKITEIRIDNYAGWLPGQKHCPGSDSCPFGLDIATKFDLPKQPEPELLDTTISAKQLVYGQIETIEGKVYYGANGKICVTNNGNNATKGLNIYIAVQNQVSDTYIDKATATLNTNLHPILTSGDTFCYPYEMSFPDPDEKIVEPRVLAFITISNHTDWMPGDASCPGPDVCYFGPILETNIDLTANNPTPKVTPTKTLVPEAGTSLSAIKTASGFVEERDSKLVYGVRGEVCVTNDGLSVTDGLIITDSIKFEVTEKNFEDLGSVNLDLSQYPSLEPGETHCYPYVILFEPGEGESNQYRIIANITINNYTGWLPGSTNCPGTESCPFGMNVTTDFTLPTIEPTIEPSPTNTPPTGTPTPTGTSIPTGTHTPTKTPTPSTTPTPTGTSTPTKTPTPLPSETPQIEPAIGEEYPPAEPPSPTVPAPTATPSITNTLEFQAKSKLSIRALIETYFSMCRVRDLPRNRITSSTRGMTSEYNLYISGLGA